MCESVCKLCACISVHMYESVCERVCVQASVHVRECV